MNFSLIIELAKRDFIESYSGSLLGFVWSFIYPLINILIYMVIFGNLMGARLPGMSSVWGYGIYLISGLSPGLLLPIRSYVLPPCFWIKKILLPRFIWICQLPALYRAFGDYYLCCHACDIFWYPRYLPDLPFPYILFYSCDISHPHSSLIPLGFFSGCLWYFSGTLRRLSQSACRSGSGSLLLYTCLRSFHRLSRYPDLEPRARIHLRIP